MGNNKQKTIFSLTEEFHHDVANIYELSCDGDDQEAVEAIEELRKKLKAFKDNLTKNESL